MQGSRVEGRSAAPTAALRLAAAGKSGTFGDDRSADTKMRSGQNIVTTRSAATTRSPASPGACAAAADRAPGRRRRCNAPAHGAPPGKARPGSCSRFWRGAAVFRAHGKLPPAIAPAARSNGLEIGWLAKKSCFNFNFMLCGGRSMPAQYSAVIVSVAVILAAGMRGFGSIAIGGALCYLNQNSGAFAEPSANGRLCAATHGLRRRDGPLASSPVIGDGTQGCRQTIDAPQGARRRYGPRSDESFDCGF